MDFSKYEVFTQTKREHNSTVIYLLHLLVAETSQV